MNTSKNIVMFATILGLALIPTSGAAQVADADRVCVVIEDENLPVAFVYLGEVDDTTVCIPLPECSVTSEAALLDGAVLPPTPCLPPCDAWDLNGENLCLYTVYDPAKLCVGGYESEPHAHAFYWHYHYVCDSSTGGGGRDLFRMDGAF